MSARDDEQKLLERCEAITKNRETTIQNLQEANVMRLAGMVIRTDNPEASACLLQASELYFRAHPADQLSAEEVIRKGWVISLPRLRNRLGRQLRQEGSICP